MFERGNLFLIHRSITATERINRLIGVKCANTISALLVKLEWVDNVVNIEIDTAGIGLLVLVVAARLNQFARSRLQNLLDIALTNKFYSVNFNFDLTLTLM